MTTLSRKYAHRKSVLRNLATSLVLYEQIKTTQAKAKETKAIVEQLINRGKKNDLAARRYLLSYLFDDNATKKVLEVLVPRYKNVASGYIKTYQIGARLGDGAQMMILKLKKDQSSSLVNLEENKGKDDAVESKNETKGKTTAKKPVKAGRASVKTK